MKGGVLVSQVRQLLTAKDKGRVWWRAPTSRGRPGVFTVCYLSHGGKIHRTSAGLRVPCTELNGDALEVEEYVNACRQVLLKARREWNRMDASGEDRLPL